MHACSSSRPALTTAAGCIQTALESRDRTLPSGAGSDRALPLRRTVLRCTLPRHATVRMASLNAKSKDSSLSPALHAARGLDKATSSFDQLLRAPQSSVE